MTFLVLKVYACEYMLITRHKTKCERLRAEQVEKEEEKYKS